MDTMIELLRRKPHLQLLLSRLKHIKEEDKRREAFYNAIADNDKAEYITGEVFIHPPLAYAYIGYASTLGNLIHTHCLLKNSGRVYIDQLMIHLTCNSYIPDIVFFGKDKSNAFTKDQELFPAPDFIAEILSPTTEKNDRGIKFTDYALHDVKEYWLINPTQQSVEQYLLQEGHYELAIKINSEMITSEAIPGFSIPIKAVLDEQENAKALQQILQS